MNSCSEKDIIRFIYNGSKRNVLCQLYTQQVHEIICENFDMDIPMEICTEISAFSNLQSDMDQIVCSKVFWDYFEKAINYRKFRLFHGINDLFCIANVSVLAAKYFYKFNIIHHVVFSCGLAYGWHLWTKYSDKYQRQISFKTHMYSAAYTLLYQSNLSHRKLPLEHYDLLRYYNNFWFEGSTLSFGKCWSTSSFHSGGGFAMSKSDAKYSLYAAGFDLAVYLLISGYNRVPFEIKSWNKTFRQSFISGIAGLCYFGLYKILLKRMPYTLNEKLERLHLSYNRFTDNTIISLCKIKYNLDRNTHLAIPYAERYRHRLSMIQNEKVVSFERFISRIRMKYLMFNFVSWNLFGYKDFKLLGTLINIGSFCILRGMHTYHTECYIKLASDRKKYGFIGNVDRYPRDLFEMLYYASFKMYEKANDYFQNQRISIKEIIEYCAMGGLIASGVYCVLT